MKKKNLLVLLVTLFTLVTTMTAFAGSWNQDAKGWWYQNDDGSYVVNTWQWIDGNNDGVAESYCFDGNGYLLVNTTTPDNYQVNVDGAWVVDGGVQTKVKTEAGNQTAIPTVNENGYVVKRIRRKWSNEVDGGTIYGYLDCTDWKTFTYKDIENYEDAKNYDILSADGDLFCPTEIEFPQCALIEILLEGDKLIKATPIWIDNMEWLYGGFSGSGEKGRYIRGRMEWGKYERDDPEYAAQLKERLTEEAKQRAYEMYPDIIVDYPK